MEYSVKKTPFHSLAAMVLLAAGVAKADITVSDVTAKQRYPWNGLVDITCTVSGIDGGGGEYRFAVAAVDSDSGDTRNVSNIRLMRDGTASTDLSVSTNGAYRLLWDAHADLGEVVSSNMVVRITLRIPMAKSNSGRAGRTGRPPTSARRSRGSTATISGGATPSATNTRTALG